MENEITFETGTPALFGALIRTLSDTRGWHPQPVGEEMPPGQPVSLWVQGHRFWEPIPSDANRIVAILHTQGKSLWMTAQARPDGKLRLLVQTKPELDPWWDAVHGEMLRQGWKHNDVEGEIEPEVGQAHLDSSAPWQVIPPGRDQDIVQLWNEGLTATQIGERYGRDKHTIHNKIVLLRKQYREEVVPYRKS